MNGTPLIKDDRVLETSLNERPIWIVRFRNDLFLKKAFDNKAELLEALGSDERALPTVQARMDPSAPWEVIEFQLKKARFYVGYNGVDGELLEKATYERSAAEVTVADLNGQANRPASP